MEFDKSRVFTTLNAHKLKVGSKVIVANNLEDLKTRVRTDYDSCILARVCEENYEHRFEIFATFHWALAYLVEPPEEKKLKWTDLKVGDIISNQVESLMVVGINTKDIPGMDGRTCHVNLGGFWISDDGLED